MNNFEEQLKQAAEKSCLKLINDGNWIVTNYNDRFKLPADFMTGIWEMVDVNKVKKEFAKLIEKELANKLVNQIAAEMSTDIKSILSIPERREAVRALARANIDTICKK